MDWPDLAELEPDRDGAEPQQGNGKHSWRAGSSWVTWWARLGMALALRTGLALLVQDCTEGASIVPAWCSRLAGSQDPDYRVTRVLARYAF